MAVGEGSSCGLWARKTGGAKIWSRVKKKVWGVGLLRIKMS